MSSDGGRRKRQDDYEEADFSNDGTSQNKFAEIKKRREAQNKIRCQRYRDKKKKKAIDEIISSQIYKEPTSIVDEEEVIKRRKEYDKQKSQRYRDKKRASNLNKLHRNQSSKTVVRHVSKCQNFCNSQIAGPS
ncbi:unnamed protein product [Parnassius mnemosyne]|uniref:BZIP domain-containing protein n=1 Tax=Parnassius mnemosyne TaxID=213953 RepID=A0AAV1LEJ0_9NEOP